jgi:putative DNA primase/helicase
MSDKIKTINLTPEIIEGPWNRDDPGPQSYDDYLVDVVTETTVTTKRRIIPVQRIALSEDSIAYEFIGHQEHFLRYDHGRQRWFIWSDTHWKSDETGEAFERIREFCVRQSIAAETPAKQRMLSGVKNAKSVETFSQHDRRVAVIPSQWNKDDFLIATPDGTVDLRTGIMREPRPDDMISRLCAVGPLPAPECPIWMQFLRETCAENQEQIDFLQKMAGYALTGDTREHALFFIYGPGGNGKSVFLNVLTGILADYAVTAPMDTFTKSKSTNHPTEIAMLSGPRLVTASETEEGKRWAEARIKSITGGDPISARFMHKDFFTFKPVFKLLIVGNHMPALGVVDDAARRRFRLVPFENKPTIVDKTLEAKLKAEWPGIFRWMINGCLMWQKEGLAPPSNVQDATNRYFSDQDILQQWLDERCEPSQGSRTNTVLAFADWTAFATGAGEFIGTKTLLTQRLAKKGISSTQAKVDGKVIRVYNNLRLKFSQSL